jgi:DNA-binding NtrC family response regulator
MKILTAWIGTADLNAASAGANGQPGPIASALEARTFDRVLLLANQNPQEVRRYVQWLRKRSDAQIELRQVALTSPTAFGEIYATASKALEELQAELDDVPEMTFHLSPGTPAMATVWIMLSATRFPAELIESSIAHGVKTTSFPFELSAELLPLMLKPSDTRLARLSASLAPEIYGDRSFRSPAMVRLVKKAERAAQRSFPILIQGDLGTGQELLAQAIHQSSPRKNTAFVTLDCSLAPPDQIEAQLFGTLPESGSSAIVKAQLGTLFLNHIEHLSISAQARLQRLLESGEFSRVGEAQVHKIDVRVIAATSCSLMQEMTNGRFREELFYRLAVLVLKTPPLRERTGDLGPLIEGLLETINAQSSTEPGYVRKRLTAGAKSFLIKQPWPGNLRELENTLRRAAVWSDGDEITESDVWDAVLSLPDRTHLGNGILSRPIEDGVNLPEIIAEVVRHYIKRAIEWSEGNKTIAANLVGLPSHQTLSNWMAKYGVT